MKGVLLFNAGLECRMGVPPVSVRAGFLNHGRHGNYLAARERRKRKNGEQRMRTETKIGQNNFKNGCEPPVVITALIKPIDGS